MWLSFQSTIDDNYREMPRDYFITKDQKQNMASKLDGGNELPKVRSEITKSISDNLKAMMIIKAQKIGLQVKDKKTNDLQLVQKYSNIGFAWMFDDSTDTAAKINIIINSTFTDDKGYEYYLENKFMKLFKLK